MAKRKRKRSTWRDTRRMVDPGPDEGGRFSPSPYALQHGHLVEIAPKGLGHELPKDSSFPKRITTQRMIDRYRVQGHIDVREWQGGNALWRLWCEAGREAKVASGYDPVVVSSSPSTDGMVAKRIDSARLFLEVMQCVPYRSSGCVRAVVIEDWPASQWAHGRGYRGRDSERHGLERLRPGLSALADYFGY